MSDSFLVVSDFSGDLVGHKKEKLFAVLYVHITKSDNFLTEGFLPC